MKIKRKPILCLLLALCLLALSAVPAFADAASGDVNGDGSVTAADARLALRAAVGLMSYEKTSAQFKAADVNGDGAITAADARVILRMAVGLDGAGGSGTPGAAALAQYDILRSGSFYLVGSMSDGGAYMPLKLAVNSSLVYMESNVDGITLGYLVSGKNTYVTNPDKKIYCRVSGLSSILLQGESMPTEAELRSFVDELGISSLKPVSQADSKEAAYLNSTSCTAYTFRNANGTRTRVYLSSSRLVGLDLITASGTLDSRLLVSSISASVPTLPPKDYKNVLTLALFAAAMADQLK